MSYCSLLGCGAAVVFVCFGRRMMKKCKPIHRKVFIYKLLIPTLHINVLTTADYKRYLQNCPCASTQFIVHIIKDCCTCFVVVYCYHQLPYHMQYFQHIPLKTTRCFSFQMGNSLKMKDLRSCIYIDFFCFYAQNMSLKWCHVSDKHTVHVQCI